MMLLDDVFCRFIRLGKQDIVVLGGFFGEKEASVIGEELLVDGIYDCVHDDRVEGFVNYFHYNFSVNLGVFGFKKRFLFR